MSDPQIKTLSDLVAYIYDDDIYVESIGFNLEKNTCYILFTDNSELLIPLSDDLSLLMEDKTEIIYKV